MKKIEFLPHIADVRIRLEADSLEQLFCASAEALSEMLYPGFCNDGKTLTIGRSLHIISMDRTTLLIDFLSELLTLAYTEKAIFCYVHIEKMSETQINAIVSGALVDGFEEDVKAVTYHEANVQKNETGNWETIVIVDI